MDQSGRRYAADAHAARDSMSLSPPPAALAWSSAYDELILPAKLQRMQGSSLMVDRSAENEIPQERARRSLVAMLDELPRRGLEVGLAGPALRLAGELIDTPTGFRRSVRHYARADYGRFASALWRRAGHAEPHPAASVSSYVFPSLSLNQAALAPPKSISPSTVFISPKS